MHQSAATLRTRTEQRGRDGLKNLYQSIGRRYPNKIKHTKKCIYSGRLKENISQHQNQAEACAVVVVVVGGIQHRKSSAREGMCGCAAENTDRKYGGISSRPSNLHTGNKQIENHTRGMRWGEQGTSADSPKTETKERESPKIIPNKH